MKIVVTADGSDLDAQVSPFFGRCPTHLFVDTDTLECEAIANPAATARGGAGIHAAQFVVEQGARAVITGNVGPNAYQVLRSANVPIYRTGEGTVRQAVEAYKAGALQAAQEANAQPHAGMGGLGRRGMSGGA
jgi:predicted Fe-Mo cluster-binding NifX family protein